jgi:tetratricopeptide (TPR) repeat protein
VIFRTLVAVVAVHTAVAAAGPLSFKPPSHVRVAQQHFQHGTKLFDAQDYAGAAVEYAAAYQLDSDAKWLLYDIATAQRKANACAEAIDAYDQFIAALPPADEANLASEGKAACASMLADEKRAADAQQEAARQAAAAEEARQRDERAAEEARTREVQVGRARAERERAAREQTEYDAQLARVRRRALELGIAGATAGVVAGGMYGLALYDASATHSATSRSAFASSRDDAYHFQDAAWIAAGAGVALVATGAVYYWLGRPAPLTGVAVVPAKSGAVLVVGGAL